MDTQSQRILVEVRKTGMNFCHEDALTIVSALENFIPDEPIISIGGYGNFNFRGVATGDIQLLDGIRLYDNEDMDLTDPRNFDQLVREELTTRQSGLLLTGKSREENDDQFYIDNIARRAAHAIRKDKTYVEIAGIGNWDSLFANYGKHASFIERFMIRRSERARVHFIAKYVLPTWPWQSHLIKYFTAAGTTPVPKYTQETFMADYGHKEEEVTVVGYSLVLPL